MAQLNACPHCGFATEEHDSPTCTLCLRQRDELPSASEPEREPASAGVCPDCGFPLADGDTICHACQTTLRGAAAADAPLALVADGVGRIALPAGGAPPLVLGRDEGPLAAALAPHDNVSRRHAIVRAGPAGAAIADLGSTNGTYLDGARLGSDFVLLRAGARIRLASDVELHVEASDDG